MIFAELVFALAIALFLTVIFTLFVRRVRSKRIILVFFCIVFLAAWAGGIWIAPAGPTFLGIYWLSFLVIGLLFALLFEAATGLIRPRPLREKDMKREGEEIEAGLSLSFFILILAFIVLIVLGYLHRLS